MIVKAKTVYTPELLKEFRSIFPRLPRTIASFLLWFIFLSWFVYLFFITKDVGFIIFFVILIAFFSLLLLFICITERNRSNKEEPVCMFEFSDNEIVVDTNDWVGKIKDDYRYYDKVIYETIDCFYFFRSSIYSLSFFILRKSDITEGSVSDLQNLLKNNHRTIKYVVKR